MLKVILNGNDRKGYIWRLLKAGKGRMVGSDKRVRHVNKKEGMERKLGVWKKGMSAAKKEFVSSFCEKKNKLKQILIQPLVSQNTGADKSHNF